MSDAVSKIMFILVLFMSVHIMGRNIASVLSLELKSTFVLLAFLVRYTFLIIFPRLNSLWFEYVSVSHFELKFRLIGTTALFGVEPVDAGSVG